MMFTSEFASDHSDALLLIADDDSASLEILKRILLTDGYRVETAADGQEALERFDPSRHHLVLLDAKMPRVSGYEVCRQLHERQDAHHIPIVIFTAFDDRESIDHAFRVGAADYITKPIHFSVLSHRIRRLLLTSYARQALEQERNLLRTLIDNLPEAVFIKDKESRFLNSNRTQLSWLNAELEETIGKTDFDFYPPELATQYYNDEQAIISSDRALIERQELAIDHSTGEQRWHETTKVPLHDQRGKIIGFVGISRDVTERRKAEEALRLAHSDLERRVEERTHEVASTNEALQAEIARRVEVEQKLLSERNLLRTLIDNVPDNIYAKDRESRFILANQSIATYMGADHPSNLMGKTDFDFYDKETAEAFFNDEQQLVHEGKAVLDKDEPNNDNHGNLRWILTTKVPLRDTDGKIYGLVGIGRDITARKFAEENLRHSEAAEREQRVLAESLRDTAAVLNSTLDPETVMGQILENVGRVVPHDAANIMLIEAGQGRIIAMRNYPPEIEAVLRGFHFELRALPNLFALISDPSPRLIEDTLTDPNWVDLDTSKRHWVKSNIAVPIQVEGQVLGFLNVDSERRGFFTQEHAERLSTFADQAAIAIKNAQLYEKLRLHAAELEQRVAERTEELQRAKDYAEAILHNTSDAIIVARADSTIQNTNPAFERLFGFTEEQIAGLSIMMLVEPEYAPRFAEALESIAAGDLLQRLDAPARRADGIQFHADLALSAIKGPDDKVRQLVCSIRDMTQRRLMELGLRETLAKEKELGELKSRFITRASHEFRTPLAVILSSLDLVEKHGATLPFDQRARIFAKIRSAVAQMAQLLEDVLSVARAQEGHIEFNPTPIDLIEFCKEILEEIAITSGKKHQFEFNAEGDCTTLKMDQVQMRHIITNLLSNAVKYSPEGSIVGLDIRCDSDQTVFQIRDSGVGIPVKDQERLFEPFHRADNVATVPGTGLGLTIAQKAAEQHGGRITVESELNHGTTFTVTIPVYEGNPAHDEVL